MKIRDVEIESKKTIGTLKGRPVIQISTKGGYHLIASAQANGIEYLGCGSHAAVAKHLARKRFPDFHLTELSKADHVAPEHFAHLLPHYEQMTDDLNAASKSKK